MNLPGIKKIVLAFLLCSTCLQAEIEKVTIKWTAALCKDSCIKGLVKQFRQIPGVAEVQINPGLGQAELLWKPNAPFSYPPINVAMRMIGLTIKDLRIRVRGTIIHTPDTVSLVSTGDNTRFLLMSPVRPNPTEYTITQNPQTHVLWPTEREEFLRAEADNLTVLVEGPLFEAYREGKLQIIVEQKQIQKPRTELDDTPH